jgi:hypothetical protein
VAVVASAVAAPSSSPFCSAHAPNTWPRFHLSDADAAGRSAHDANAIFSHGQYRHVMNQRNEGQGTGWGHAVSTDWVTWERLPLALRPARGGQNYDGGVGIVNGEPVLMWDCTNDPVCNTTAAWLVGGDAPIVGIARPADTSSDAKLSAWIKDSRNPIQVDKGVGHYNAPSNIWSPGPGRWDVLFCLGWDKTWNKPITTALYTTTDPTLHSWVQKNASFFAPHYGGGGSFWPIPGTLPTERLSHMISADFHGDGHGTFALGHYDAASESFSSATERGGVVDFSSGVSYFELGYSPPSSPPPSQQQQQQQQSPGNNREGEQQRLVMIGWTSAGTAMTIVREIGWDVELEQLLAVPVAELTGGRAIAFRRSSDGLF